MNLVVVSNDRIRMRVITNSILEQTSEFFINEFVDPMKVPKYVLNYEVEAVFADIKMKPSNGIQLLNVLKFKKPSLSVFLISSEQDNNKEDYGADGIIQIPLDKESFKHIIVDLKK